MSLAKALIFVALITTISAAVTCPQCPVNDCGLLPPEFRYECPNGNILDECGCVESCLCAGCPPFDTSLPCPNGKEVDANMCPLTECKFCPLCPVNDCGLLLPEFRYECPNGNILDECGCVASCLCAGCPPFNTSLPCPNGKKVDANMCPISECNPVCELTNECAAVFCANGVTVDEYGCPLKGCPCKGSQECPPLVGCSLDCSTRGGYRRDADRCVICECETCPQCPVNDCGLLPPEFRYECSNGNILDECGCVESCLCAGCPPFDTSLPCPNGKKVDANMCPLTECKPPTCEFAGDCAAVTCEAGVGNAVDEEGCPLRGCPCRGSADCPPLVGCSLDCSTQGGYRRDANRCVICECAGCPPFTLDPSCNEPPRCEFINDCAAVTCLAGIGTAEDEFGCPLPGCPCKGSADCPRVNRCDLDCSDKGGYVRDPSGCVTCECNGCSPLSIGPQCPTSPVCNFNGDCAAVSCFADFGNAVDENGCALPGCPCHAGRNCPVLRGCTINCTNRGRYKLDRNGCVTCECRQRRPFNQGRCPRFGASGARACQNDADCPGYSKCCQKRLGQEGKVCHRRRGFW